MASPNGMRGIVNVISGIGGLRRIQPHQSISYSSAWRGLYNITATSIFNGHLASQLA